MSRGGNSLGGKRLGTDNNPSTSSPPCLCVIKNVCQCRAPVRILPVALDIKNVVR